MSVTPLFDKFQVLNLVKEESYFYGKEKYTKEKVEEKVAWIAQQLKKMNAGIVGFEEVFHTESIMKMIRSLNFQHSKEP